VTRVPARRPTENRQSPPPQSRRCSRIGSAPEQLHALGLAFAAIAEHVLLVDLFGSAAGAPLVS